MRDKTKTLISGKNNRPNSFPLLYLLSVLIRSGSCSDDSDFDVSDSESSTDDQDYTPKTKTNVVFNNVYLTKNCVKSREHEGRSFELPRRDTYFVSRRDLLESMLNEMSHHDTKLEQQSSENDIVGVVSDITCHLCFNDLDKTLVICALAKRIIQDRKVDEYATALKALTSLIHIQDRYLNQRIQSVTSSIFEGIVVNSEYEKELMFLLGALHDELLNRTSGPRGFDYEVCFHGIIFEKLEFLVSLFGQNIAYSAKHKILGIVESLLQNSNKAPELGNNQQLPEQTIMLLYEGFSLHGMRGRRFPNPSTEHVDLVDYVDEEIVKGKIFETLKDLHMSVCDVISSQCSESRSYGISPGILNHSQLLESSKFHEYFAVLRKCLDCKKVKDHIESDNNWVHDITTYLVPVFWVVDNGGRIHTRPPADILKGEMIRFLERLAILDLNEFLRAFLDESVYTSSRHHDPISKLMDVFVTSNNNYAYNEYYMKHYYRLLAFLANKNEHFYKVVLNHDNWKWALKAFVFDKRVAKPGLLYDILLGNTLTFVKENGKFKKGMFNTIIFCEGTYSNLEGREHDTAVLRLLATIFRSELLQYQEKKNEQSCMSTFVSSDECSGMSKISSITKILFSHITDTDETGSTPAQEKVVIANLYNCVDIMNSILTVLHTEGETKVLRESWPEADEINSIFIQLITKPKEEWESLCQNDQDTKNYVEDIVAMSRELHSLLLSIVANQEISPMKID